MVPSEKSHIRLAADLCPRLPGWPDIYIGHHVIDHALHYMGIETI